MTRLAAAFASQSESCAALGSPFMARLMALCAARWPEHGAVADALRDWPGDLGPSAASLPLRIASGLHALALSGQAPDLAALYPPRTPSDDALWSGVETALERHAAFLTGWTRRPPQTNEVRRAAALIPVAHMLAARFGLPLRVSELGASAGLNLNFDRFRLTVGDRAFGPQGTVPLSPDWTGPCPAPAALEITERRGVDLTPLDPADPQDALRLMACLWPDQPERLALTRAAMALPPAPVDEADGVDWLAPRLAPVPGAVHLVYTTIAWQYFPADRQAAGRGLLAAAGAAATEAHPLAFLTLEADGLSPGAALTLQLWPRGEVVPLARVDFHGRWVDWSGPITL